MGCQHSPAKSSEPPRPVVYKRNPEVCSYKRRATHGAVRRSLIWLDMGAEFFTPPLINEFYLLCVIWLDMGVGIETRRCV
jgi:hypothetical protein